MEKEKKLLIKLMKKKKNQKFEKDNKSDNMN